MTGSGPRPVPDPRSRPVLPDHVRECVPLEHGEVFLRGGNHTRFEEQLYENRAAGRHRRQPGGGPRTQPLPARLHAVGRPARQGAEATRARGPEPAARGGPTFEALSARLRPAGGRRSSRTLPRTGAGPLPGRCRRERPVAAGAFRSGPAARPVRRRPVRRRIAGHAAATGWERLSRRFRSAGRRAGGARAGGRHGAAQPFRQRLLVGRPGQQAGDLPEFGVGPLRGVDQHPPCRLGAAAPRSHDHPAGLVDQGTAVQRLSELGHLLPESVQLGGRTCLVRRAGGPGLRTGGRRFSADGPGLFTGVPGPLVRRRRIGGVEGPLAGHP